MHRPRPAGQGGQLVAVKGDGQFPGFLGDLFLQVAVK